MKRETTIKDIGAMVRKERLRRHWGVPRLEKESGVTMMTINNLEKGLPVSFSTLQKICSTLEIEITFKPNQYEESKNQEA